MVVTEPALILPDEQSWALWGPDAAELGLHADQGPAGRLRRALAPRPFPGGLGDASEELLAGLAAGARVARLPGPAGELVARASGDRDGEPGGEEGPDAEHGGDDEPDGDEEHDMMAIVGEPSADGLVMEDLELTHGPFGTGLPGGLELGVCLDGDVVASCRVRARLRNGGSPEDRQAGTVAPDLLAPAAWRAAIDRARGRPVDLREVERERALSHVAWLRALGRVLGDERLAAAAGAAVGALRARAAEAEERVAALEPLVLRRTLGARLGGRGVLDAAAVEAHGLRGPIARAAGIAADDRTEHPAYRALGFAPRTAEDGDVLARARLRLAEALDALSLADRLPATFTDAPHPPDAPRAPDAPRRPDAPRAPRPPDAPDAVLAPNGVEGPRGPLLAARLPAGWVLAARGAEEARRAGGELVVGLEWGAALVVLCSLDLSPWWVGPPTSAFGVAAGGHDGD